MMPATKLKRAEQSIAPMREDLPPETLAAIEEITAALRAIDQRLDYLAKGDVIRRQQAKAVHRDVPEAPLIAPRKVRGNKNYTGL